MTDLIGHTLGQYTLTRELGRGGMAVVYEAYQPSLNRHVALKVLPAQFTFDGVFVERFLQEARAAARLAHPNIVPIYDVGNQDGQYYIVMQKLPGEALSSLIAHGGRLSLPRAAHIVAQVASALDYAHQRGFVHRDVKPANIFVAPDDHAWLTDFGIARAMEGTRLTQSGMVMGTPEYMSPEQAQGEEPGPRGDVYALGIVLYEMLAGRAPFQGSTPLSVLHKQVYDAPPAVRSTVPDLPPAIEVILSRALEKDPARRYATAGELARAVQGTVQASAAPPTVLSPAVAVSPRPRAPTPPRPVTPAAAAPAPVPGRRFPVLPIIAGAAAVVLLVVLAVLSSRKTDPPTSASLPTLPSVSTAAPVAVAPTSTLAVAPASAARPVTITVEMPPAATETRDTVPMATLEPVASIALNLSISQRAWVRVVVDGQVVEENILEAGTTRTWEANSSITVRTGNGGGVNLILNGKNLGPMGNDGQVVERTWIVDQGEVTEAPTGTLVPTATLVAPTLTRPPARATATRPAATATAARNTAAMPPRLVAPKDRDLASGTVTFNWEPAGALPAGAKYEVVVWSEGEAPDTARGIAAPTDDYSLAVNLDELWGRLITKTEVNWTVLVVYPDPTPGYKRLTTPSQSSQHRLTYQPPDAAPPCTGPLCR